MTEHAVTAVTLDAGNTLLYSDPAPPVIYARHLSRYGRPVDPDEVAPVFAEAWAHMQRHSEPGRDRYSSQPGGERAWWGALVREVVARLDHEAPWEPLLDDLYRAFASSDVWHPFPETLDTLRELHGRGLRLAVISNWDGRLPAILHHLGIDHWLDALAVSALEGVEKPARAIFHRTLDRLGVAPAQAVHVGDSPYEDYQGAKRAGLSALLLDRRGAFDGAPYERIDSLDAVLDAVA